MKFTEDTRVKIPAILHLICLGYQYLSLKDQRWDLETNISPDLFKKAIGKINPGLEEDFSVVVGYDDIAAKNYSLSAGQYFDVKIEYVDITPEQFEAKMRLFNSTLDGLFSESARLQDEIKKQLALVRYEV